jgi:rare lipoprotein A (peptidoglycan hydrolase)
MFKSVPRLLTAVLLAVGVSFAADLPAKPVPQSAHKSSAHKAKTSCHCQVGTASWYGKAFHGRETASGEPYDMFQFTAASKTLPLGSFVKVTNLRNGKWIVVRVNDRGPYVGNRIIDLSYGAAQMLSFRARGIERVKLEPVASEEVAANVGPSFGQAP